MSNEKTITVSIPPEVAATHRPERAVNLAEIETWLTRLEDEDVDDMPREDLETDLEVAVVSYVPGLLDEIRAAHGALDPIVARRDTADGPPLPLATRVATAVRIAQEAVAARDAAIALGYNDGRTVGEQAESICLLADVLRGKSITVEHRCADPAKCPLCLAVAETDPAPQTREDENPEQERERHLRSMRDALAFFEEWAEAEDYGAFPGGDPRFFTPDPDASTDEERAAHKSACEAWERGDRIAFDVGPLNSTELRVKGRVVPPGTALVNCQVFGLGTVVRRDAEMMRVRDGLRAALASIQGPVDSGFDVEEPARRGVEQAEGDGSDPGSEGAHAGSIAAGAPSRKGNRHDPLAGLTEEQRAHLAALAADPVLCARFNGSTARIAVLNAPTPPERQGAAGMREYLNGAFDLTITAADLATALGISEADMAAIEAGTKATDDAGWTTMQTACFSLGSGTKPEHIADPASSPAFQRAMESEDDAPEETDPAPPWHRDRAVVGGAANAARGRSAALRGEQSAAPDAKLGGPLK